MVDLDQGGAQRRWTRIYLGPSLGYVDVPNNTQTVTVGGTTLLDKSTTTCLVNFNGAVTIQLPPAVGFNPNLGTIAGVAITIIDIGGFAGGSPITIQPTSPDTIMGLASIQIATPFGAFTLLPNVFQGGWNNE